MVNYFLANDPGFGRISWVLMLGWLLTLGVGAYLYNGWQERSPVRRRFFRQLGLGLSVISAASLLLLALKAFGLPFVSWRLWTYLAAVVTLAFLGWAGWFYTTRLPRLLAAVPQGGRAGRGGARTYASNGSRPSVAQRPPAPPRPVATTGRRDARRDKKRKGR